MNKFGRVYIYSFKQKLFIVFLLAPFIFPTGLQYSSQFSFFYSKVLYYWRILDCGLCMSLFFIRLYRNKITRTSLLLFLCILSLLLSTIIKGASFTSFLTTWGGFFCFYVGAETFIKEQPLVFISALEIWLYFVVIVNLITMVLYPNGMPLDRLVIINQDSKYTWFWGFKNTICNLLIPFLTFVFTNSYISGKRMLCKRNLIAMLLSLITGLLSNSGTLGIVIILFVIFVFLYRFKIVRSVVNPKTMAVAGVVISVLIVFFNIQYLFSWLIVGVLGKDITLTQRTIIWMQAIADIRQSPLWGYGVQSSTTFGLLRFSNSSNHCHNAILTLAYQGGILAVVTYGVFFFYSLYSNKSSMDLKKVYSNNESNSYDYLLGVILLLQMIIHITGSISGVCTFILLLIISSSDRIIRLANEKNEITS